MTLLATIRQEKGCSASNSSLIIHSRRCLFAIKRGEEEKNPFFLSEQQSFSSVSCHCSAHTMMKWLLESEARLPVQRFSGTSAGTRMQRWKVSRLLICSDDFHDLQLFRPPQQLRLDAKTVLQFDRAHVCPPWDSGRFRLYLYWSLKAEQSY